MNEMRNWMLAVCVAACALLLPGQAMATTIVVDPGHGGSDPGAIGINGLQEKDVTLDIASRLNAELLRRGYHSVLSRTDDRYIPLQGRVDFTEAQKADVFVSVHANWYSRPAAHGSMVLYYDNAYPQSDYPASRAMAALTPQSRELAQSVLDAFVPAAGTASLGLTPSSVYVVRRGNVPSILVETAFLSNPSDAQLLADDRERTQMALGIANGIQAWIPPVFPDLAGHWAKDAVLRLKQKGIVDGRMGDRFAPDDPLTRAEFVTMLGRAFPQWAASAGTSAATASDCRPDTVTGSVYGKADAGCTRFVPRDLPPTHWAYAAMSHAFDTGLLDGYADGTVRPDRPITREEVAVLLDRMINGASASTPTSAAAFIDVPAGSWSSAAIERLKASGIVDGISDTSFAPARPISRAELSVMLDRYLGSSK